MLHTKFRENPPPGSGEEDFWRVFTIYGRGGHLGHVTHMPRTNFRSPYPSRLKIKFGFDWASGFWEEDVWNCLRRRRTDDGRTTDGLTPDHGYPISSPIDEPNFGSGELKSCHFVKNNFKTSNFFMQMLNVSTLCIQNVSDANSKSCGLSSIPCSCTIWEHKILMKSEKMAMFKMLSIFFKKLFSW